MTTKLNATTSGLVESVDTSGVLELQTGNVSALVIGTDQNANFTGTTAITVPNGTTAQRPTPVNGMMRYNTSLSIFEVYANNTWSAANVTPTPVNTVAPVISGSAIVGQNLTSTTGTWSGSPSAYYYQWRANSTAISNATANVFSVTLAELGANITCNVTAYNVAGNSTPATSNTLGPVIQGVTASYLVVAGGGGGGWNSTGGGGGGGLLANSTILQPATTYTIVVGAGGSRGTSSGNTSTNGANSSISGSGFTTITAIGGGRSPDGGGGSASAGASGGSGGGASTSGSTALSGGSGTAGQGYAGGNNAGVTNNVAGGGGGAGAAGANGSGTQGGAGGNGAVSSISGSAVTYAGGGGAGVYTGVYANVYGAGGSGGGGQGGTGSGGSSTDGSNGTANLGGGGGGSGYPGNGGLGGSGVVIISYAGAQQFGGGVVSTDGSNTIHTFYTSGSLVPLTALSANYLIVAGGGGGGYRNGGGGGAGGLISGSNVTIDSNSTYVITVGSGGGGSGTSGVNGANGANSSFSALANVAIGGGGGGTADTATAGGVNGGSGGGGGGNNYVAGTHPAGSGTAGQGNNGGTGASGSPYYSAGGGGGAGQTGFNGSSGGNGGAGGNGTSSSISGVAVTYAGGGGGGSSNGGLGGAGGTGGGGAGGDNTPTSATNGTANLGGGGGGSSGGGSGASGANGGSGVVIISYPGSTPMMAGGNVTVVSNTVVHTFTSSGYLTSFVNLNNSLRFRGSNSAYLARTPSIASNRQTWTYSTWFKVGTLGSGVRYLFGSRLVSNLTNVYINADKIEFEYYDGTNNPYLLTSQVLRDPAAWYHLVAVFDTTNATASDRMRLYLNGTRITAFSASSNPSQNLNGFVNYTNTHYIGQRNDGYYFDGYMAETRLIDGQALGPNYFGAFSQYGVWQPIAYSGSYGTNGFYLPFSNTANTSALGYDFSGNQNNWSTSGISLTAGPTYDAMVDVPTNTSNTAANYCTWNPTSSGQYTRAFTNFSNGNLLAGGTASGMAVGTMQWGTTGKFYFEQTVTTFGTSSAGYGICNLNTTMNTDNALEWNTLAPSYSSGQIQNGGSIVGSFSGTYAQGDIIGFAVDVDNGTMAIYKNNTLQTTVTTAQLVSSGGTYTNFQNMAPFFRTALSYESTLNCGQRPFAYTPPAGYLPLNSYNI